MEANDMIQLVFLNVPDSVSGDKFVLACTFFYKKNVCKKMSLRWPTSYDYLRKISSLNFQS